VAGLMDRLVALGADAISARDAAKALVGGNAGPLLRGGMAARRSTAGGLAYWVIRLFCSTFTRLSVQKVQLGP
jgi:hypothetical protein